MLIVFYADKNCGEYENILDILFLSCGLLTPAAASAAAHDNYRSRSSHHTAANNKLVSLSEGSMMSLRSGICLIIEETLLTLENAIVKKVDRQQQQQAAAASSLPRYFQRDEFQDVDQEVTPTLIRSNDQGYFLFFFPSLFFSNFHISNTSFLTLKLLKI